MAKFEVGDILVGNNNSLEYAHTTKTLNVILKVVATRNWSRNDILVRILKSDMK